MSYHHLSVDDGLSQSHVESIVQDHDGYIWLGTANGLNRYDGHDVRIYSPDSADSTSLSDETIQCLLVDSAGRVWVGTSAGLDQYHPDSDSFLNWPGDPSHPRGLLRAGVFAMAQDREGFLWVGTAGLDRIDPENGAVEHFPFEGLAPGSEIRAIFEDHMGRLWIGVAGYRFPAGEMEGLYLLDPDTRNFVPYSRFSEEGLAVPGGAVGVTGIGEDENGTMWIAT